MDIPFLSNQLPCSPSSSEIRGTCLLREVVHKFNFTLGPHIGNGQRICIDIGWANLTAYEYLYLEMSRGIAKKLQFAFPYNYAVVIDSSQEKF